MTFLRRALLLVSFAGAAWLLFLIKTMQRQMTDAEIVLGFGGAAFLCLVFFYVLQMPAPEPRFRLARMFKHWMDAKENELASRARSPSNESSAAAPDKS